MIKEGLFLYLQKHNQHRLRRPRQDDDDDEEEEEEQEEASESDETLHRIEVKLSTKSRKMRIAPLVGAALFESLTTVSRTIAGRVWSNHTCLYLPRSRSCRSDGYIAAIKTMQLAQSYVYHHSITANIYNTMRTGMGQSRLDALILFRLRRENC